ncbi:MAG: exodeoxyribonuclease VII small subunit [Pseudomonadota bacterium]
MAAAQDQPTAEPDVSNMSFEQALAELEAIVTELESGTVELEQSISLYQRGDALKRHCQSKLDAARAKIEAIQISADGNAAGTAPFDEPTA